MHFKHMRALITIIILISIVLASVYYFSYNMKTRIRISTTASLYATGLLDFLNDEFQKNYSNVVFQFIPVGSGAALRLAEQGDVQMVFVHAPNLEKDYIEKGVIMNQTIFAYNYFIIVGPKDDPAKIVNLTPIEAMKRLYNACEAGDALFVSRGDESGTHQRELLLWNLSGLVPSGKDWYIETGSGMAETLLVANEKKAYTISDIGTYTKLKGDNRLPDLIKLVDKGEVLLNIYSIYIVSSAIMKQDYINIIVKFIEFVMSDRGQDLIGSFGLSSYGQSLFYPAKGHEEELQAAWEWFANLPP